MSGRAAAVLRYGALLCAWVVYWLLWAHEQPYLLTLPLFLALALVAGFVYGFVVAAVAARRRRAGR